MKQQLHPSLIYGKFKTIYNFHYIITVILMYKIAQDIIALHMPCMHPTSNTRIQLCNHVIASNPIPDKRALNGVKSRTLAMGNYLLMPMLVGSCITVDFTPAWT